MLFVKKSSFSNFRPGTTHKERYFLGLMRNIALLTLLYDSTMLVLLTLNVT